MNDLDISLADAEGLVALGELPAIGPKSAKAIAAHHATLAEAVAQAQAVVRSKDKHPFLNKKAVASLSDADLVRSCHAKAVRDLDMVREAGGFVLSFGMPEWPGLLSLVDDAPLVLRVFGRLEFPVRACACVGTRQPNAFGAAVTERMTAHLCEADYAIVSGLANGVDWGAHKVALEHDAHAIGVIGYGFGSDRADKRRIDDILEAGGTVVSEFGWAVPPSAGTLMNRNRTLTGLSAGTCAMQGSTGTGGTRKAVSDAYRQGRPVFIPRPPSAYADPDRDALIAFAEAHEKAELLTIIDGKAQYPDMLGRLHRSVVALTGMLSESPEPSLSAAGFP